MDFSNFWWEAASTGPGPQPDPGDPGDPIANSLRFRGGGPSGSSNTMLSRSNLTCSTTFTQSVWLKLTTAAAAGTSAYMGDYDKSGSSRTFLIVQAQTAGYVQIRLSNSQTPVDANTVYLRDPSAWYHLVITSNATANESKVYINGLQIGVTAAAGRLWTRNDCVIGHMHQTDYQFEGYSAQHIFIDGEALEPTTFGRFNANGVWVPVEPQGLAYGNNGFHLTFEDPADVGKDYSGNDNHFTATGFDTNSYASGQFVHNDLAYDTGTNTVPSGGAPAPYFIDIVDPRNTNQWSLFGPTHAFNGNVAGSGNNDGTYLRGSNSNNSCNELTFDLRDFPTVNNCAIWAGWNQANGTTSAARVHLLDASKVEIPNTNVTPVRIGDSCERLEMCSSDVGARYIKFDLSAAGSEFFLWGIEVNGQILSQEAKRAPTYDLMADSPTQNHATFNPLAPGGEGSTGFAQFNNANLQTTTEQRNLPIGFTSIRLPLDKKIYCEFTATGTAAGTGSVGVTYNPVGITSAGERGWTKPNTVTWHSAGSNPSFIWINEVQDIAAPSRWAFDVGVTNSIAVDTTLTPPRITFGAAGANPVTVEIPADNNPDYYYLFALHGGNASSSWNFGQQPFLYTPPDGFEALQTQNLPTDELPDEITGTFTGNSNANGPFVYTGCIPGRIQYGSVDVTYDQRLGQTDVDFLSNGFKVRSTNSNSGTVNYTVTTTHTGGEYDGKKIPFYLPAPATSN